MPDKSGGGTRGKPRSTGTARPSSNVTRASKAPKRQNQPSATPLTEQQKRGKEVVKGLVRQMGPIKKQGREVMSVNISSYDWQCLISLVDPGDVRSPFELAGITGGVTPILGYDSSPVINSRPVEKAYQVQPGIFQVPASSILDTIGDAVQFRRFENVQAPEEVLYAQDGVTKITGVRVASGFESGRGLNIGSALENAQWTAVEGSPSADGTIKVSVAGKVYNIPYWDGPPKSLSESVVTESEPSKADPLGQGEDSIASEVVYGSRVYGDIKPGPLPENYEVLRRYVGSLNGLDSVPAEALTRYARAARIAAEKEIEEEKKRREKKVWRWGDV